MRIEDFRDTKMSADQFVRADVLGARSDGSEPDQPTQLSIVVPLYNEEDTGAITSV